jgi:hypothetical protein
MRRPEMHEEVMYVVLEKTLRRMVRLLEEGNGYWKPRDIRSHIEDDLLCLHVMIWGPSYLHGLVISVSKAAGVRH